jgi:putative transposase
MFHRVVRLLERRDDEPFAGIIDSQSVKTAGNAEKRGYDAGKKVTGRKRHLLVDTLGLVIAVMVHSAGIQDYDGAKLLLEKVQGQRPRLSWIWADSIYRHIVDWTYERFGWLLKIVTREPGTIGFQVQPRRWVVERTFAWLGKYRRHSKDYETKRTRRHISRSL